jgi:hypothetical protein
MSDHAPGGTEAPTAPAAERAVPPGPGVVPPFPAPPTEGRSVRLWLGLGIGALVTALCCGGGLAAGIGLVVSSTAALHERVQASVGGYFAAVRDKRWSDAYRLLCDDARDAETPSEFAARAAAEQPIRSYRVGDLNLAASDLQVPVDVVYGNGTTGSLNVHLTQDQSTGDFEVCGIER